MAIALNTCCVAEGQAKNLLMELPSARYTAFAARLGWTLYKIRRPVRDGKAIACEYWFRPGSGMPDETLSVLTLWEKDIRHAQHRLFVKCKGRFIVDESSADPEWLLQLLAYCTQFVIPRVADLPWKEVTRQAPRLVQSWIARNPKLESVYQEGRAKDFILGKGTGVKVDYSAAHPMQSYWSCGSSRMLVLHSSILSARGSSEDLFKMVARLLGKLRAQGSTMLCQRDNWQTQYEGTQAMHRALARLIEQGELEQWGSVGDMNTYKILSPVREAEEQLPRLRVPPSFAPGTAKKFIMGLAQSNYKGEVISRGARFRKLMGHRNDGVYLWEFPSTHVACVARIVVVLLLPQGYGNPDRRWLVQQDWCSFELLKLSVRSWRNLQGSKLFINGVPKGTVSYHNPALQ